jgi:hypothetical protein
MEMSLGLVNEMEIRGNLLARPDKLINHLIYREQKKESRLKNAEEATYVRFRAQIQFYFVSLLAAGHRLVSLYKCTYLNLRFLQSGRMSNPTLFMGCLIFLSSQEDTSSGVRSAFGDSARKEDQGTLTLPSIMTGSNILMPEEFSFKSIVKARFEELSVEHGQAFQAYTNKHGEKDMDRFLANFNKDREGNTTMVGEITFPSLHNNEKIEIPISDPFTPEQIVVLQYYIIE